MNVPNRSRRIPGWLIAAIVSLTLAPIETAFGQNALKPAFPAQGSKEAFQTAPPIESMPTFQLRSERNLVLLRVVVRDDHGRTVGNLKKNDFRIFDNGKGQKISVFAVRRSESNALSLPRASKNRLARSASASPPPTRFLALFFDDVHLETADLTFVRKAADKYIQGQFAPGVRIGLYTASNAGQVPFTANREDIEKGINGVMSRVVGVLRPHTCMTFSDYEAYRIVHLDDLSAQQFAYQEYIRCYCPVGDASCVQGASGAVRARAIRVLSVANAQSELTLQSLRQLIQKMATLPGERVIGVISPGFVSESYRFEESNLADISLRSHVVINAIDARGLFTAIPGGSVQNPEGDLLNAPLLLGEKDALRRQGHIDIETPLANLSYDTGGVFINNTNDIIAGLHEISGLPRIYYVLAFSPKPLRHNGQFHHLRVKLTTANRYSIQARRGYTAPGKVTAPGDNANNEIQSALLSPRTVLEFPVHPSTQLLISSPSRTNLKVMATVNPQSFRFRREGDHQVDRVKFVAAIFDHNGNFIRGWHRDIRLRMADATYADLAQHGFTVSIYTFTLKPGHYMVREVVLDEGSGRISSVTQSVQIPN